MALAFPLSTGEFIALLPVSAVAMRVPEAVELSQTAGGEVLANDIGARLWQGEVTLGRLLPWEADEAQTLIDLLSGAGRSFYLYDTRAPGPRLDPDGAALGASTVQIRALGSDNRSLQLKGLPAGYVLKRGDKLAFDYGSNPVRRALHRVVEATVTASGTGNTGDIEVVPNIRTGAAVDAGVELIKPACKAVLVPGSVQTGTRARFLTEGISFRFMQTLR